MRRHVILNAILAIGCWIAASHIASAQTDVIDNNAIISMVRWHLTEAEIIADIRRNQANFDLSPATINVLKNNGVSDAVIDEMFAANKSSLTNSKVDDSEGVKPAPRNPISTSDAPAPNPQPSALAPVNIHAKSTSASTTGATQPVIAAHTPQRLAEAIGVAPTTTPICDANASGACVPVYHMSCPPANDGKTPNKTISLYFASGTSDPTRIDQSGAVCFEIRDFNDILYTPSFQVSETVPTGSALDYLQDAIKTVTGFSFGASTTNTSAAAAKNAAAKQQGITPAKGPAQCPSDLTNAITTAQAAAATFGAAMSQITPSKDNSGKFALVDWQTTTAEWGPVPYAYQQFEAAVSHVIADLSLEDVDVCTDDVKAAAEAIVIDTYLPARGTYTSLASHVASDHVVRMTSQVHSTSSYSIIVQANYPSGTVSGGSKTFSLTAGRKILSSSGGFLVTEVPSTSYASVTAPSGMANPATQNVLAVNNPGGPSLGLTALLHVYLPTIRSGRTTLLPLNGYNWGLALAAGPTYNLSNGKADTSKFGLFTGVSFHIRNQLFLTPGVNLAEYSNWPVGFSAAGQVIPANVGTPTGVSRWTARFGFAITFKIKDFGQSTTATASAPATKPPATSAPAKTP